jgi:CheY-like chemotaxis protein
LLNEEPAMFPGELPLRVLVVEDHNDTATILGVLLELWGHEPRLCRTGAEALAAAADFAPHAVLLDIGLVGGMDGYEVARRLRQQPALREAVVIAVTGYGQDGDRERARQAGCDHHLLKPYDPCELERLLAEAAARPCPMPGSERRTQQGGRPRHGLQELAISIHARGLVARAGELHRRAVALRARSVRLSETSAFLIQWATEIARGRRRGRAPQVVARFPQDRTASPGPGIRASARRRGGGGPTTPA